MFISSEKKGAAQIPLKSPLFAILEFLGYNGSFITYMYGANTMAGKRILVNVEHDEVRVSVMQGDTLSEYYVERGDDQRHVGEIIKGRVDTVVPGIQSAFVDVGLEKNGFLYVTDVMAPQDREQMEDMGDDFDFESYKHSRNRQYLPIEKMLSPGDEILVQVEKDPIGNKGVRLTTFISLPGRFTVLMPGVKHRGISKKVSSYDERSRLRDIVNNIRFLKDYGCIVRTAANGREKKQVVGDFKDLVKTWNKVQKGFKKMDAPAVLHSDRNLLLRVMRDHYTDNVSELNIDDKDGHKTLRSYFGSVMPEAREKVQLFKHDEPIFHYYGIEKEIQKIYQKTASLPCGGYLVIEQTEALVAIDVNTGRHVGRGDFEKTVFKTNWEAAMEIPRQLRLRDIGGIVIIDFIDMKMRKNQMEIFNTLIRELKKDKSKTNILQISRMGLIEMTRQRRGHGIFKTLHDVCSKCDGRGYVKSVSTSSLDIIRYMRLLFLKSSENDIIAFMHPDVVDYLLTKYRDYLSKFEKKFGKRLDLRREYNFRIDETKFVSKASKREIEI